MRNFAAIEKTIEQVKPQATKAVASFHFDKPAPPAPASAPASLPPAPTVFVLPDLGLETEEDQASTAEADVSWLRSLVQKVVVFFDRPPSMEPWTKELGPSLMLAIDKLGLTTTSVVTGVRYVRKGRPMVFDEATGELIINRSHHGVRALAARVSHDPRARLLLVVNAVREINRVLEVVTDATERRVLLALLRGEAL